MTSITFDTLDALARLRAAGLDENVAVAIVDVVKRTADLPDTSIFAQKSDVLVLRTDIERLEKRIDQLQSLMLMLFGLNVASVLGVGAFLYAVLK